MVPTNVATVATIATTATANMMRSRRDMCDPLGVISRFGTEYGLSTRLREDLRTKGADGSFRLDPDADRQGGGGVLPRATLPPVRSQRRLIPNEPSNVEMRMGRLTKRMASLSDEALLAGMASGDEEAGVVFVRRYQGRVFGLAVGMVGDAGLAEDIAQEALVRVWKHAAVFDPRRGSVATWALNITRNLAIDALRLRRATPTDPGELLTVVSDARSVDEQALAGDAAGRLRGALATLPVEQQRAVVLAGVYGHTAAEVAATESIPLGTAKTRIRAGMQKLTVALQTGERMS